VGAPPAILVENLSFRHAGRKRPALDGISFRVDSGETLLVLGPSGSGKSTLALCLNGLIPQVVAGELTGRVQIGDVETRRVPVAELSRQVGLVFQDPDAQFCMLRVDDEIAFGLENLRTPRPAMHQRIRHALSQVGLAQHERSAIGALSGGTRQRVALASILAMEPPVLVFDEPTSNLDPAGTDELFATIAALRQRGDHTLVVVEHRLDSLMAIVDRVIVLGERGQLVASGAPEEVFTQHAAELRALGVWVPQVAEVASELAERGIVGEPFPLTVRQAADAFGSLIRLAQSSATEPTPPRSRPVGVGVVGGSELPPATRGVAEPAIQVSHLSYTYPQGQLGLRDVSLRVERGEFVGVVGPNGAGKSTLAQNLIGIRRSPAGAVRILGQDTRQFSPSELARLIGFVFQNPEHQFVARTVFDELAFGLRARGRPENQVQASVAETLESFRLQALALANPYTLSFGEKRRLSVATALILDPTLLILDEPTFGQDRRNTEILMERLAALHRAGRTIVMITHDLRLVAEYATSVAVMIDGAISYHGNLDGLLGDAALLGRAHMGLPPLRQLADELAEIDPTFPRVASVQPMVDALAERLVTSTSGTWRMPENRSRSRIDFLATRAGATLGANGQVPGRIDAPPGLASPGGWRP
jgi:energy-coupling factor transport system ATP-binding protein